MKTNVFSPRQSRYILVEDELQQCLEEMYPGYEFNIQHINDRWVFEAPVELSDKQKREIANRIAELRGEEDDDY